jgi:SPP1 gp7 family putative phage head morphogenesis protein
MSTKELKPALEPETLSDPLRDEILRLLRVLFFDPLTQQFEATKNNAAPKRSKLARLIESGDLVYSGGTFTGKLDAETGKLFRELGARFNKTKRGWDIPIPRLPLELQTAVNAQIEGRKRLEQEAREAVARIQATAKGIIPRIDLSGLAMSASARMDERVQATLREAIAVQPTLSGEQQKAMRKKYTENVQLSIVGFIDSEVLRFRKEVLPNIQQGMFRSDLQQYIQKRLNVGRTRAKFIARQETSLFTSQQKELQYLEAGIQKYKWQAIGGKRGDGRTRDSHRQAHGKVFFWGKPVGPDGALKPVNGEGKPVDPGIDFQCRCVAVPIVETI